MWKKHHGFPRSQFRPKTLPPPRCTAIPMSHSHTPWTPRDAQESESYEPKAVVGASTRLGLQAAGFGAFVAAIQNALGTHNRGATGVFTRYGGTIGIFGAHSAGCSCPRYRADGVGHNSSGDGCDIRSN